MQQFFNERLLYESGKGFDKKAESKFNSEPTLIMTLADSHFEAKVSYKTYSLTQFPAFKPCFVNEYYVDPLRVHVLVSRW